MVPEYFFAAVNILLFNFKIIESRCVPPTQQFLAAPPPNLPPTSAPSCYPQVATAYFLPAPPSAPKITVLSPGTYLSSAASSCPSNNLGVPPTSPPTVSSPSIPSVLPSQPVFSPPPVPASPAFLPPAPTTVLAPPVYLPPTASSPPVPPVYLYPTPPSLLEPLATPPLPVPPVCSSPTQPSLPAPPICLASTPPPLPAVTTCLDPISPTQPAPPVSLPSKSPPYLPVLSELKRHTPGPVPPPEEICLIEEPPLFRPPPTSGPSYPDRPQRIPEHNLRFDQDVLRGFLVSLGI